MSADGAATLFVRRGERYVAWLAEDEVRVLRKVSAEMVGLLTDGFGHDDPVVRRLFPDVYPDAPDDSAEFRRFTEGELKTGKVDQAGAVLAGLPEREGEVSLDPEAADAWLRALTDARLAMGVRLGLDADTDLRVELDLAVDDDPGSSRVFQLSVYAYLGFLQESLLEAVMGAPVR
ncbi:DUF2017 domain-containing protein [Pilimelia columellifera subsp. columellifera]|uniref:DUF2017 domain-containing protein n=1 Tax=Pilimelia columellifera subsp. columellifera TaxID=706583 RepID=A0ABP6AU87_9ACTN